MVVMGAKSISDLIGDIAVISALFGVCHRKREGKLL
jgi:hypothetical protein